MRDMKHRIAYWGCEDEFWKMRWMSPIMVLRRVVREMYEDAGTPLRRRGAPLVVIMVRKFLLLCLMIMRLSVGMHKHSRSGKLEEKVSNSRVMGAG